MTEIVRVAISDDLPKLEWPPCCPVCGGKKTLRWATSRLGRVKSIRPDLGGGLTMKSDVMYLSFPMCEQHAGSTSLANVVLEKSPLMQFLRLLTYMALLFALPLLMRPSHFLEQLGWFTLVPVFGILGTLGLLLARRATGVWPVRFDPDMDVIILRFRNEEYASKFRLMNRKSTSNSLTEAPPWYLRSIVWKVVVLALAFAFLFKQMGK